jgi:hypothetical protein
VTDEDGDNELDREQGEQVLPLVVRQQTLQETLRASLALQRQQPTTTPKTIQCPLCFESVPLSGTPDFCLNQHMNAAGHDGTTTTSSPSNASNSPALKPALGKQQTLESSLAATATPSHRRGGGRVEVQLIDCPLCQTQVECNGRRPDDALDRHMNETCLRGAAITAGGNSGGSGSGRHNAKRRPITSLTSFFNKVSRV